MQTEQQFDTNRTGRQLQSGLDKTVKLFWGPEPISFLRFLTVKSLCHLNPGWKIELSRARKSLKEKPWRDENRQDFESYDGEDYSDHLNFPNLKVVEIDGDASVCSSHQSNFFKWKAMAEGGCVYSDMDILYVKPLDTTYDSLNSADMVINHNGKYFSHGFMSSKGVNPFFAGLYDFLLSNFRPSVYQGAGSNMIYAYLGVDAPDALTRVETLFPEISIWNFPDRLVYPWPYNMIPEYFVSVHKELPAECIGLHWYGGAPLTQDMNKRINIRTFKDIDNTVCYHARKLFVEGVQ